MCFRAFIFAAAAEETKSNEICNSINIDRLASIHLLKHIAIVLSDFGVIETVVRSQNRIEEGRKESPVFARVYTSYKR